MSDKLFIVNDKLSTIAPGRQMRLKEMGIEVEQLPEEAQTSTFWSNQVILPERLRESGRIRKAVSDYMAKVSTRGSLGRVVAPEKIVEVAKELKKLKVEHDKWKDDLIANWEKYCDEAVEQLRERFWDHPLIEDMVSAMRKAQPLKAYLEKQVQFNYSVQAVTGYDQSSTEVEELVREGFRAEAETAFQTLLKETASKAEDVLELFARGDDKTVNRRTLKKIEDYLIKKLRTLSFLDPRLKSVATRVESALRPLMGLPKAHTISVNQLGELVTVLSVLSNPERLQERLDALDEGEDLIPATRATVTLVDDDDQEQAPAETQDSDANADETDNSAEDEQSAAKQEVVEAPEENLETAEPFQTDFGAIANF